MSDMPDISIGEKFVIPIRWYIGFMFIGAALSFVSGFMEHDMHFILGGFLFTAIGGGFYYALKRQNGQKLK